MFRKALLTHPRRYKGQRLAASAISCALALSALAPVAAFAAGEGEDTNTDTTTATQNSPAYVTHATITSGALAAEEGEEGTQNPFGNVAVTVPTSLPLAAKADGSLEGPSNARLTNTGSGDVTLKEVHAQTDAQFSVVSEEEMKTTKDANAICVSLQLTRGTNEDVHESFSLKDAKAGKVLAWDIAHNAEASDSVTVVSEHSSVAHITDEVKDQTGGAALATLRWTFEAKA